MAEADGTITVADKVVLYQRLSVHLTVPGRLDDAIVMLEIQVTNMLSPDSRRPHSPGPSATSCNCVSRRNS